ncbi:hypothetical protein GJ698_26400 [Pseudoduganella sp. FT26W]|uniref:Uncharacterized protein n=1 Tax=Duganella aquatilis TaxID=2666082 RepID=A0A844D3F8_9BURK|nr:hypothetical protein [Duganella aquatilis]MRW87607.1 hypothetical protein [Duganella aquatilis]
MDHPIPIGLRGSVLLALRVTMPGRVRHAAVEGHHIIYNGKPVSPSRLANTGDVVRNAWRVVWLKLPGEEWERAADRRAPWRT